MRHVATICTSLESVRRTVDAAGWLRIGIDGVEGVGKSYLAEQLSERLGCPVLDLDAYLFKNQGAFVPFIDYPALSSALAAMPQFILIGVCLKEVLANSGTELDGHIYIKRMRNDDWADEAQCDFPEGVDAAIEALANYSAMVSRSFDEPSERPPTDAEELLPALSEEIMRYHDSYCPHETADLIYERQVHGS